MKIYEIREMSTDELIKRIQEEERNLVDLRFSHHLKQLTNTAKLKLVRRDIAKMKTVLRERELKAQKEANSKTKEGAKS
ncbi:Ribosomal protein L29 [Ignavibacterium album JCM 16511]|jgi:large subunit ribosomal protein L29|uniref:Large ribosomal subunit protein uL29 n=1 Tax=Ignavibacterium album (strain DSM 19864 / JCM 16511 / NBRC 101810 / Mat9-16) TaxID=945713 RepID=I0AI25_IGNAJ|nr:MULTISPECIES: 50S ribosomal protein L29 [Ignavibacterium]AFH48632.1 Ribosomal protein L29 [Ignavibacterium album JCM 16511]BDQ04377.1 MAG: 50S ribosomal protein L29 [Ignavibacterium sp.]